MVVKVALKWGTFELSVETDSPEQCEKAFASATEFLAENPGIGTAPAQAPAPPVANLSPKAPELQPPKPVGPPPELSEGLLELITHAGLTPSEFATAVSVRDPQKPRILPMLKEGDRVTKQRKAAAVVLAVSEANGKPQWPVFELTQALKDSNIDTDTLSRGLNEGEGKTFFRKSGNTAASKYELEVPGRHLAIETLKELVVLARQRTAALASTPPPPAPVPVEVTVSKEGNGDGPAPPAA